MSNGKNTFLTSDLALKSFNELSLAPATTAALEKLNIKVPTAIQKQALPVGITGTDLIGVGQTGSGKTLVYALTILKKIAADPTARALVLAPSREVADQVFNFFNTLIGDQKISICLVIAGLPDKKQVSQLNKGPRIIIATPGRLLAHLENNKLLLQKLSILVVDEADRMLDIGFEPQLNRIRSTLRGSWQTLMFGASFDKKSEKFAVAFVRPDCVLIRSSDAEKPVETLKQIVVFTDSGQKMDHLLEALKSAHGQCIVFVNDQANSELVHNHISENGITTDVIHGAMKHGHRQRVITDFRDKKFRALVTTDLLARGIDVPDIECVVNFDLPNETEDFLHRIGRTARAGKRGTAISFVTRLDEEAYRKLKPYLGNAKTFGKP